MAPPCWEDAQSARPNPLPDPVRDSRQLSHSPNALGRAWGAQSPTICQQGGGSVGSREPFRKITFHPSGGPGISWLPTSRETGQMTPEQSKKQQQVTSKTGPHCSSVRVCQTGEDTGPKQWSQTSDSWHSCPHILSLFSYANLASSCMFVE